LTPVNAPRLSSNRNEGGAQALVHKVGRETQAARALEPTQRLLDESGICLREASTGLQRYLDSQALDPERLRQLEERLSTLHDMARKHHIRIEELADHLLALQEKLRNLETGEEQIQALHVQQASHLRDFQAAANTLHELRARKASKLAERISVHLRELGMPDGVLQIEVRADPERPPSPHGIDHIEFRVSANRGHPPQPLSKIASGGELSRISLAIQVIAATGKGVPTLVFDEVDVGIGGAVAETVGRHLRILAAKRQVLCVTHLPQVASCGHHHLQVSKKTKAEKTLATIQPLSDKTRLEEIARMLGGIKITPLALRHAQEMLDNARGLSQGNRKRM
jgi:DNA repair protein RecN (Recombination protein N)